MTKIFVIFTCVYCEATIARGERDWINSEITTGDLFRPSSTCCESMLVLPEKADGDILTIELDDEPVLEEEDEKILWDGRCPQCGESSIDTTFVGFSGEARLQCEDCLHKFEANVTWELV